MNHEWPGTALEQAIAKYLVEVTGGHWVTIVRQDNVGKLLGVSSKRGGTLVIRDLLERVALSTDAEPVVEIVQAESPFARKVFGCDIKALVDLRTLPVGTKLYTAPPAPSVALKALDTHTMQKLREALRFSASRSVMSSADEARILSALSAQVQDVAGWQDISTAPKDGSEILLYREDCGVLLGRWISCSDFVVDGDPSAEFCQSDEEWEEPDWFGADFVSGFRITNDGLPTHWMALPTAPAAKQG